MHAIFSADDVSPKTEAEPKVASIEFEKYDYFNKRSYLTKPNNLIESVIHMLMCGLGGGLVALHAAYMECGIFSAMALNVALSAMVGHCACMLVCSAQKLYGRVQKPKLTYPDVMEIAVSTCPYYPCLQKKAKIFRYLVEVTLLCHLYGSCCVFLIMIARNLKELVSGDGAITDGGEPPLKVVILSLMIPCAIICMVTDLKRLAPFALICDLFAVALVLVLLWYSLHDIKVSPLDRPAYKSVRGLVEFTCICVFVLEPVSYALPIENNMGQPEKFHIVVLAAAPIYTMAMMTVGFFGYWYYGENAIAPITVHFPFSPFAVILKVFLCLILYVIYALCFYLAFDLEWHYLKQYHKVSSYWFWERLYRVIHVVALTSIAYSLPNVTRLMGILGAFSTIPAVLIFPPLIDLLVNWNSPDEGRHCWRQCKCVAMILLGLILCGTGSYVNVDNMMKEMSSNTMVQTYNMSLSAEEVFWKSNGTHFKYDIVTVNLAHGKDFNKTKFTKITTTSYVPVDFKNTKLFKIPSHGKPYNVTVTASSNVKAQLNSRINIPILT